LATGLDGSWVIVRANPTHGVLGVDPTHDGEDGNGSAGSPDPATTSDLDLFVSGSCVRFTEHRHDVLGRAGQLEVPPSDPPIGPLPDLRITAQQVDSEVRGWCITTRLSAPGATDETTVWKSNYPSNCTPTVHLSTVVRRHLAVDAQQIRRREAIRLHDGQLKITPSTTTLSSRRGLLLDVTDTSDRTLDNDPI